MSMTFGFNIALMNSFYRLKGYINNGLKWKRVEKKLYKYDLSSEHEKQSIWGFLRIRD